MNEEIYINKIMFENIKHIDAYGGDADITQGLPRVQELFEKYSKK